MYKPALRSHTHLQAAQSDTQAKACKRVCLPNRTDTATMDRQTTTEKEGRTHNSGLAKVAVQWLCEHLCFVSSSVVADSFVLLNPPLL